MSQRPASAQSGWRAIGTQFLPFADAASETLPLGRLIRLSLFQVSFGITAALLTGVINRVMIVELGMAASLVALMVALPLVFAPLRALIGHKSDTHRSILGWRRSPYIWFGSLFVFGGLAIMPFALLILSGDTHGPLWIGYAAAALAFLLAGAGMHTVQTAGLALATDIAPEADRPRVVALLFVMLLLGLAGGAAGFGLFLQDFNQLKLIQAIQGAAVVAIALNVIALWKQEARQPQGAEMETGQSFAAAWSKLSAAPNTRRLLMAVFLGSAAFGMQDILLEPYGGEILGMSVSGTTLLTGIFALGALAGFALSARRLSKGQNCYRMAGFSVLIGVIGFSSVVFADPLQSANLFRFGAFLIGLGGGIFTVCTLTAAMQTAARADNGITLGAWGAANATGAGLAVFAGGAIKDLVSSLAVAGDLGPALVRPAVGYSLVYHIEILLLFATLIVIGPLARHTPDPQPNTRFGLAAFPG
ncbi:MAG: BCD family MFS transporter [Pseudomonadota bacterium]